MKQFAKPEMSLIQLAKEDLIITSGCETNTCYGYDCPDCPTICKGIYHCEVFKCQKYHEIWN